MVGPGGVKDYSAFQEIILQLVEAIVATRRCLVRYQAPGRSKPNGFRYREGSHPTASYFLYYGGT